MTEGTLARWLKKEGETIKAGDVIAEIETDKATMEVEAVDEGVLGKILVAGRHREREGERADRRAGGAGRGGAERRAPAAPAAEGCGGGCRAGQLHRPRRRRLLRLRRGGCSRSRTGMRPGRAAVRLAAGAADGSAGGDRSVGAEGQRTERTDRAGGYRGGAEGRRGGCAGSGGGCSCRLPRLRRRWPRRRRRSITAPHKLVPHSINAEGYRPAVDRGDSRPSRISMCRWISRSTPLIELLAQLNAKSRRRMRRASYLADDQRPGHQGGGGDTAAGAGGERQLDRRRDGGLRRCRYQRRCFDPGRTDHADHSAGGSARGWRRSAAR